jgi:hypothetical protein
VLYLPVGKLGQQLAYLFKQRCVSHHPDFQQTQALLQRVRRCLDVLFSLVFGHESNRLRFARKASSSSFISISFGSLPALATAETNARFAWWAASNDARVIHKLAPSIASHGCSECLTKQLCTVRLDRDVFAIPRLGVLKIHDLTSVADASFARLVFDHPFTNASSSASAQTCWCRCAFIHSRTRSASSRGAHGYFGVSHQSAPHPQARAAIMVSMRALAASRFIGLPPS